MKSSFPLGVAGAIAAGLLVNHSLPALRADAATPAPAKLRWSPPALDKPITLQIGEGRTTNRLKPDRDYIIKLPATKKIGGLTLQGGRNIVIQGGSITVPPGTMEQAERRAIYIKGATGTVHIEGVSVDNSGGSEFDGIAIAAPEAIVQIENVRITGLTGSIKTIHADIVQPWGGVKELRIDRLTGGSNYQGLQIPTDQMPIGSATIQNVNLRHEAGPNPKMGYLLWLTPGVASCSTYPITLSNVYIEPRPGQDLSTSIWPPTSKPAACPAVLKDGTATWPGLPEVKGEVKEGKPANGDFVPETSVGLSYVSPGYEAG